MGLKRFFRSSFRKEIGIIILIKLVMIFVLWSVCFSDPVEKHLTTHRMQQQIIGS